MVCLSLIKLLTLVAAGKPFQLRCPPRQPSVLSADCYHHGERHVFVAAINHDFHFPTSAWHSLIPTNYTLTWLVDRRGQGRCPPRHSSIAICTLQCYERDIKFTAGWFVPFEHHSHSFWLVSSLISILYHTTLFLRWICFIAWYSKCVSINGGASFLLSSFLVWHTGTGFRLLFITHFFYLRMIRLCFWIIYVISYTNVKMLTTRII